ncbi:MAG: MiaB/RimO family radical SAM methylthiotransferase, partial [Oscillospiraceae bacterium]|nr:MiaB/RimO family radical SAM methylthiotransferase [Oscillospiraceae bacterium]
MDYLNFNPDTQAADLVSRFYKKPPLAFVHSFGCQQNVNDGERIQGVLSSIGYGSCEEAQQADVIIFNTCAVREHAEKKVLSIVGNLKVLKAQNANLIIGICGCMVQQKSIVDKIKKSYPYVDLVFGVNNIDALPGLIAQKLLQCGRIIFEPADREDIVENVPIKRDSTFKAWVPIMYGCDNFCSYCIVPYVRGRERSRNAEDIYDEVSSLVAQGYKEVTLLGQNVNSYGKTLDEPIRFAQLLEKLCEIPGQFRLRFMSSHPKDATKELIDVIAAHPDKLCNNIHLPIQSGSNRILDLMNRRYTAQQYMELINYAKEKIADVTFSSDILV